MNNILVAGLINMETTVAINKFPIEYSPIEYNFFGIESTVSGVGYNVAKAVKILGGNPQLLSIIGNDIYKNIIYNELEKEDINTTYIKPILQGTAMSVILYDTEGVRKVNLDLKDIQDSNYPKENIHEVLEEADIVVICNINFARGLLKEAKKANKLIATDVHVVDNIDDDFNKEFMSCANILFMSNENILGREEEFVRSVADKYDNDIIVVGMGKKGALLYVKSDKRFTFVPAVYTREIISTIGAGDALFSAFIYFYSKYQDAYKSLELAVIFASYKIGEKGAASGFISEKEITMLRTVV